MAFPYCYSSAQLPAGAATGSIGSFGTNLPINFSGQTENSLPSAFTAAGWVRLLSAPAVNTILFSVSNQFQMLIDASGNPSAQFVGGTGAVQSEVSINDGNWHYVGVSFLQSEDGSASGTLSLYIDGFQADTEHVAAGALQQAGECAVGVNATSLDFASWSVWSTPVSSDVMDVPLWGAPATGTEADRGLVAAWDFANGPASDQSGQSNSVAVAQQLWHVPCVSMSPGSYATPASLDNLNPGAGAFTLMGWAYVPAAAANTQYPLISNIAAAGSTLQLYVSYDNNANPGVNYLFGEAGAEITGGVYIPSPMQWTHLALTYDGSQLVFYINGNPSGAAEQGTPPPIQNPNVTLGKSVNPGGSNWYMQGLSVWTQALQQSAIQGYMNGNDPTDQTGCVAFFPLVADLGNSVTGNSLTTAGTIEITECNLPISTFTPVVSAPVSEAVGATAEAASEIPILQLRDYRRLAAQQGIDVNAAADPSVPELAAAMEWYEKFLTGIPPRTAQKLRAMFARNVHVGFELAKRGIRTGGHSVSAEGRQLVIRYHTPAGPQEVARITTRDILTPFQTWALTVTLDVVGIVAAMFGIFSTAAKVQGAVSFEEELLQQLGLAAQSAENANRTTWALDSILNMAKVMWEWKILFTLFKRLITGSWWSLTFTILSLIAQVAALVASGGWLIALKVSQMAIAIGQLIYDLTQMPASLQEPSAAGAAVRASSA